MRWEEASDRLHQANPSLAAAFDQFYHQLDEEDRSKAAVSLQSYPFTTKILDTGTPSWPDGSKVGDEYVVAKGLPFGVILSRSCEIFEHPISSTANNPKPMVLLPKGNCIGLFELFDQHIADAQGGQPDWTISAGSVNIRSVVNFDAAGTRNQLKKLFGTFDADRFASCTTLSEKALFIPKVKDQLSEWTVDILFFNRFWFDCLFEYEKRSDEGGFAACRLTNELHTAAWTNVSKIRASNTSYMRFFSSDLKKNTDMRLIESSHALFMTALNAVRSRAPVYILDSESEDIAPVKTICEELLKHFMEQPVVIRPAYLGSNYEVGYMPLEFISPYILRFGPSNHNTYDTIVAMAQKIRNASDSAIGEGADLPILVELAQLFDNLAFRVPAAVGDRRDGGRASAAFRVFLDGSRNIKDSEITSQAFFHPYLDDLENQRCEFFRACARISLL